MFKSLLAIFLKDTSILKFILGVIAGFSFSMAIVLGTVGIMDGFEKSLKEGLRKATGELYFYSHDGLFELDQEVSAALVDAHIQDFAPLFQTEGFAINQEKSRGVILKGIEFESFFKITGLDIQLKEGEIAIGSELAKTLNIKPGEELAIALANGHKEFRGLPEISAFKVGAIISHGIFEKDLRIIYISRKVLQGSVNAGNKINSVIFNAPKNQKAEELKYFLKEKFKDRFVVRIYWEEYKSLLEAIKVEKTMISLIFQLVIIISIFNVFAFVTFLNERKSQEVFLLKALGLPNRGILKIWFFLILGIWGGSCLGASLLVQFFALALSKFSFLQIPGEIYHLAQLKISLSTFDYCLVFALSLVWLLILFALGYSRLKSRSILERLRKEFV